MRCPSRGDQHEQVDAVREELIADGGHVELRLLGEVELRVAGRLLAPGPPRQQSVLAALVVDAGQVVAAGTLIDRVWGSEPPFKARNVLNSYLSRIRGLLAQAAALSGEPPVRLGRGRAGYVLDVEPDVVDLHRFSQVVAAAREPQRTAAEVADMLAAALRLWRGQPLAALSGQWVAQVRGRWHEHRLEAVVRWARAELRLGHPAEVINALQDLVAEYPLVEPLEGLLMQALHAAGRAAEAIDRYSTIRQRLAAELGTDPGIELRTLHQAIMRDELPRNHEHISRSSTPVARPAQLPAICATFVGREAQVRAMTAVFTEEGHPGALRAVAIDGPPGVGKTTLALRLAHEVAVRYPDGQPRNSPQRRTWRVSGLWPSGAWSTGTCTPPMPPTAHSHRDGRIRHSTCRTSRSTSPPSTTTRR